jgi:hypothetical protein
MQMLSPRLHIAEDAEMNLNKWQIAAIVAAAVGVALLALLLGLRIIGV